MIFSQPNNQARLETFWAIAYSPKVEFSGQQFQQVDQKDKIF